MVEKAVPEESVSEPKKATKRINKRTPKKQEKQVEKEKKKDQRLSHDDSVHPVDTSQSSSHVNQKNKGKDDTGLLYDPTQGEHIQLEIPERDKDLDNKDLFLKIENCEDAKRKFLEGIAQSHHDIDVLVNDIGRSPDTDALRWVRDRLQTLCIILDQTIEDLDFEEMEVKIGDRFDPRRHRALPENNPGISQGSGDRIIERVERKGYLHNGKVVLYPIVEIGRRGIKTEAS